MKRPFDILFSLLALSVFALPCSLISFLLLFKEKHAIFFRQQRIGKTGKPFEILKFQTLVNEVPTETGRILRKTGLDELPQFINVLKGEMSIVGPRALTAFDIERLGWNDRHHSPRWSIKPGITGLAQLYGGQHRKTSWFWDLKYIKNENVLLDSAIVALSFLMNIFGKTRVRRKVFNRKNLS